MSATISNGKKELDPDHHASFRKEAVTFRLRREVEAMEYIRALTSIPMPLIIDEKLDMGDFERGWILMERLPQASTIAELTSYLKQSRAIRSSEPVWIRLCSGGPAYDHRLDNLSTCGPYASIAEFHDFLVAPVKNCPRPELVAKYRSLLCDDVAIVFAHADISWENILVEPTTGAVTGIIDWEMAGFWPEWWDSRKALYASRGRPWWIDIVKQIMPECPKETETDMDLEMYQRPLIYCN